MRQKLSVLIFLLTALTLVTTAQDLIFKRSGEVIPALGLSSSGQSRSYRLADDPPEIRRFISTSLIDSIRYENGRREIFQPPPVTMLPSAELKQDTEKSSNERIWDAPPPFHRHAVGVDLAAAVFYRSLRFSYEYLLGKGRTGLHASISVNLNPEKVLIYSYDESYNDYYGYNLMNHADWNARLGYQVFIFPPGLFRFAGGLYYVTGQFTESHTRYIDQEPWTEITLVTHKSINGLLFAPIIYLQLSPNIRLEGALDIPLVMEPDFSVALLRAGFSLTF
jgi:hypothetical protein